MGTGKPVGVGRQSTGRKLASTLLGGVGVVAALIGLGIIGLRVPPSAFGSVSMPKTSPETIQIPDGLPAPVERFFRLAYGDRVPVIGTAVVTGTGTMRPAGLFGITFPTRFRFFHQVGRNYRHYIELTAFGLPIMKVNEYFVDGKERMELPMGVQENNPRLDQGGLLGMWVEILNWLPAAVLTDPQVRWEPIDDSSAWLIVPFRSEAVTQDERILLRFDPTGSRIQYIEAMRYNNGAGNKVLWINGAWFDDGSPWFTFGDIDIALNVDVDTSLTAKGP